MCYCSSGESSKRQPGGQSLYDCFVDLCGDIYTGCTPARSKQQCKKKHEELHTAGTIEQRSLNSDSLPPG